MMSTKLGRPRRMLSGGGSSVKLKWGPKLTVFCRTATALFMSAIASPALAECSGAYCSNVYIEQLYLYAGSSTFWIRTSGTETLLNCTADSGVFLRVASDSKELYALLLSAQLADKLVEIRINEGSSPCTVLYATMNRQ